MSTQESPVLLCKSVKFLKIPDGVTDRVPSPIDYLLLIFVCLNRWSSNSKTVDIIDGVRPRSLEIDFFVSTLYYTRKSTKERDRKIRNYCPAHTTEFGY